MSESTASLSEHPSRRRRRVDGPWLLLFVLVTAYVGVVGWLTWRQQARFGTFGFDMGIHDQGIWLLSRFERPFVTVRGLHYLGHHLNLVSLLFVPAYWLGAGPSFLFAVQTLSLGVGAVPVFLLARDVIEGGGRWVPLVPAAAYLLHPTLGWINWWHFHPEALAIAPLLLSMWLARRGRWGWFAACVALVLATKEDLALAVTMLGVVLAVSERPRTGWRPGAITAAVGLGWYLAAMQVVMPWFHGGGEDAHYVQELYPTFGDDAPSILWAIVSDPGRTIGLLTDGDRLAYYGRLLAPVGFVGVLGLPFLVVAGPQVAANALSALSTTYDARYHYSVVPVAVVSSATVFGLGVLRRRLGVVGLRLGLVVVLAGSLLSYRAWPVTPAGSAFDDGYWLAPRERQATFEQAVAAVPADASVAATYFLVPHLTHRRSVYEWPNPWVAGNWGFANRDPHDPAVVDHLVLDLREGQEPALLASLRSSEFPDTVFESDGVVVLARRRAR